MRKKQQARWTSHCNQKPRWHQLLSTKSQKEQVKLLVSDNNDNHDLDVFFDVIIECRTMLYETVLIRWPGTWKQKC